MYSNSESRIKSVITVKEYINIVVAFPSSLRKVPMLIANLKTHIQLVFYKTVTNSFIK